MMWGGGVVIVGGGGVIVVGGYSDEISNTYDDIFTCDHKVTNMLSCYETCLVKVSHHKHTCPMYYVHTVNIEHFLLMSYETSVWYVTGKHVLKVIYVGGGL